MLISRFISAGHTDVGKVRSANEDQYLIAELNKSMTIHSSTLPVDEETELYSGLRAQLVVVADGMSGMAGAGIAGQIGIGTTAKYILNTMPWFFSLSHDYQDDQQDELMAAMRECQEAIESQVLAHPELQGMGTTLTMAYIVWPRMYVVHIGDSRCYLLRAQQLTQLTHDHTVAQALVDTGAIAPERAAGSSLSRILVNSIGHGSVSFHPEVYTTELEPGDKVLLCTDGLSSQVDDEMIADVLSNNDSADIAARSLVYAANEAGGADNVTAVVSICYPPIDRPNQKPKT